MGVSDAELEQRPREPIREENLLVLICKDYKLSPDNENEVLDVSAANEMLSDGGVMLTVDTTRRKWKAECSKSFTWNIERDIGFLESFRVGGLQNIDYHVGVYDVTNKKHMQNMVDAVIYIERCERHPGLDIDGFSS